MSTAEATTLKRPIAPASFEKRTGRPRHTGHGSPAPKNEIVSVALEDRIERVREETEPRALVHPAKFKKGTSLEKRLLKIRDDDPYRYRKKVIVKVPLSDRLEPASRGCFLDPYALIDMLKRSAGQLLEEVLDPRDNLFMHVEWNLPLSKCECASYQDAACMMRDAFKSHMKEEDESDFSVDYLTDDEYSFFLAIVKATQNEANRRQRAEDGSHMASHHAPSFPAYTMPLPQLFQAAAECSKSEERKEYFRTLYDREFRELLEQNELIKNVEETYYKYQPVRSSSYCDLVTATQVLIYAGQSKKMLYLDAEMSMIYTMVLDAFTLDRDQEPEVWSEADMAVSEREEKRSAAS